MTHNPPPSSTTTSPPPLRPVRLLLLFSFVVLLLFVIFDTITNRHILAALEPLISSTLEFVSRKPIAGVLIFALAYAAATLFFLAGVVLTLSVSFALASATDPTTGFLLGTTTVFFGASLGATIAFLLSRSCLRDEVNRNVTSRNWLAIDAAMETSGVKILTLLRLSPLIPFSALSYLAGTTSIPLRSYVLSLLGMLPGTVLYVYIGATAASISSAESGNSVARTVLLVFGVLAGVAAVGVAAHYSRLEIAKMTELETGEGEEGVVVVVARRESSLEAQALNPRGSTAV